MHAMRAWLVFMQLTRDLFAISSSRALSDAGKTQQNTIAKFLFKLVVVLRRYDTNDCHFHCEFANCNLAYM